MQRDLHKTSPIETADEEKRKIAATRGAANIFSSVPFYVSMKNLSDKPIQVPEIMMIAHCAELSQPETDPSKPSEPMLGDGKVN